MHVAGALPSSSLPGFKLGQCRRLLSSGNFETCISWLGVSLSSTRCAPENEFAQPCRYSGFVVVSTNLLVLLVMSLCVHRRCHALPLSCLIYIYIYVQLSLSPLPTPCAYIAVFMHCHFHASLKHVRIAFPIPSEYDGCAMIESKVPLRGRFESAMTCGVEPMRTPKPNDRGGGDRLLEMIIKRRTT